MMRKKWTPEMDACLLALPVRDWRESRAEGPSEIEELAAFLGKSRGAIASRLVRLRRAGKAPARSGRGLWTAEQDAAVLEELKADPPDFEALAVRFERTIDAVRGRASRIRKLHGIAPILHGRTPHAAL